ncbi:HNH endonuclease signature motif containing protein [Falsiroseomonas selenitidurans]|uniref:HNH endonuclease n=1 Tax=Falsiroseomonas selenitidurans TaxID=2716335 RepID=A0ABX1DZ62_9PROT|nr:HNH endonuclease signature motif containing protein [Falsiroseomonas selenitidurans]NKC30194.1 HNH endonuclease [Falsiroseomonas selenitidurans]
MPTRLRPAPALFRGLDQRVARPQPKRADPIYATPDHARWRAEVVRRSGGQCQAPGCGRTGIRLFADHIVELRDGGAPFDPANGQALCGACHSRKTAAARAARQRG